MWGTGSVWDMGLDLGLEIGLGLWAVLGARGCILGMELGLGCTRPGAFLADPGPPLWVAGVLAIQLVQGFFLYFLAFPEFLCSFSCTIHLFHPALLYSFFHCLF